MRLHLERVQRKLIRLLTGLVNINYVEKFNRLGLFGTEETAGRFN